MSLDKEAFESTLCNCDSVSVYWCVTCDPGNATNGVIKKRREFPGTEKDPSRLRKGDDSDTKNFWTPEEDFSNWDSLISFGRVDENEVFRQLARNGFFTAVGSVRLATDKSKFSELFGNLDIPTDFVARHIGVNSFVNVSRRGQKYAESIPEGKKEWTQLEGLLKDPGSETSVIAGLWIERNHWIKLASKKQALINSSRALQNGGKDSVFPFDFDLNVKKRYEIKEGKIVGLSANEFLNAVKLFQVIAKQTTMFLTVEKQNAKPTEHLAYVIDQSKDEPNYTPKGPVRTIRFESKNSESLREHLGELYLRNLHFPASAHQLNANPHIRSSLQFDVNEFKSGDPGRGISIVLDADSHSSVLKVELADRFPYFFQSALVFEKEVFANWLDMRDYSPMVVIDGASDAAGGEPNFRVEPFVELAEESPNDICVCGVNFPFQLNGCCDGVTEDKDGYVVGANLRDGGKVKEARAKLLEAEGNWGSVDGNWSDFSAPEMFLSGRTEWERRVAGVLDRKDAE